MSKNSFGFSGWTGEKWDEVVEAVRECPGNLSAFDIECLRELLGAIDTSMFIESDARGSTRRESQLMGLAIEFFRDWKEDTTKEEFTTEKGRLVRMKTFIARAQSRARRQGSEPIDERRFYPSNHVRAGGQWRGKPLLRFESELDLENDNDDAAESESESSRHVTANVPPLEAALRLREARLRVWLAGHPPLAEGDLMDWRSLEAPLDDSDHSQGLAAVLSAIWYRLGSYRDQCQSIFRLGRS